MLALNRQARARAKAIHEIVRATMVQVKSAIYSDKPATVKPNRAKLLRLTNLIVQG